MPNVGLRSYYFFAAFTFLPLTTASAKECRSELDSNLREIGPSTKANGEFLLEDYYNNDKGSYKNYVKATASLAIQANLSSQSLLYFNGALKYAQSDDSGTETSTEATEEESTGKKKGKGRKLAGSSGGQTSIGLKSLYYQWSSEETTTRAGFMGFLLDEGLLLNERAAGIYIDQGFGRTRISAFGAAVDPAFAMEGQSCVSKPYYEKRETEFGMDKISDNFAGMKIEFTPFSTKSIEVSPNGEDEFMAVDNQSVSSREFNFDITYYTEDFDQDDKRQYIGLHHAGELLGVEYGTEAAVQYFGSDQTFGYLARFSHPFSTKYFGLLTPFAGYTAYQALKGERPFAPANSNLFIGERMQYLTADNNIGYGGLKVKYSDTLELDVGHFRKQGRDSSYETDFMPTYKFSKFTKFTAGYAEIYLATKETHHQYTAEIRHVF